MWNITYNPSIGTNIVSLFKQGEISSNLVITVYNGKSKSLIKNYHIFDNKVNFVFEFEKGDYTIYIKEGKETYSVDFNVKPISKNINSNIIPFLSYHKGVITLKLKTNKINRCVNISGDFNTNVNILNKETNIEFHTFIDGYKLINLKIDNEYYSQIVYNPEQYPSHLILTSNGCKTNRVSASEIQVSIDDIIHTLQVGQTNINYQWQGTKEFIVYLQGVEIFREKLTSKKDNYLPELILLNEPLRAKLGSPSLQKVELFIKGHNRVISIPSGETEVLLNLELLSGIQRIEIDRVVNAIIPQREYTFLIYIS